MKKNDARIIQDLIKEYLEKTEPVEDEVMTYLLELFSESNNLTMQNCLRIARKHGYYLTKRQMKPIRDKAIMQAMGKEQAKWKPN